MLTMELSSQEWEALEDYRNLPQVKLEVCLATGVEVIPGELLEECWFQQGQGGYRSLYSRGEITLKGSLEELMFWAKCLSPDMKLTVSFRFGEDYSWHKRFTLYVDQRGARWTKGKDSGLRVGLQDFSALMEASHERGEWEDQAVFLEMVVCDKTRPEKSLVHQIAQRWDIPVEDVDCSLIDWTIPYVKLKRSDWEELSDLARSYGAHLECGAEKTLTFAYSSFQEEPNPSEDAFLLQAKHFYQMKTQEAQDRFFNDLRLKWHRAIRGERQRLWNYQDNPVNYDADLKPFYPFRNTGNLRAIQNMEQEYHAPYSVNIQGQEWPVVHAVDVDEQEVVEAGMIGSAELRIVDYDKESSPQEAQLHLECLNDGDLETLEIWGVPYYQELNRCCFRKDEVSITQWGRRVANLTGPYFTMEEKGGEIHCEKWVNEELEECGKPRKRYYLRSELALFPWKPHCKVRIDSSLNGREEPTKAQVEEVYLGWKKGGWMRNRIVLLEESP